MTAILTTLWAIIKWTTIVGGSIALVVLCIVIFHPIYFTLSGRASVKGQRGEVRLTYLFNIIKIRYIASVHTQDVWLEIFKWRKLIQRESRIKPSESTKTYEMKSTEVDDDSIENVELDTTDKEEIKDIEQLIQENDKEKIDVDTDSTLKTNSSDEKTESDESEKPEELNKVSHEPLQKEEVESEVEETIIKKVDTENIDKPIEESSDVEDILKSDSDITVNEQIEPEYKVEATPEQLAQLQSILEAEEKKEEEAKTKAKKDDWQAKLRKFKKDFNRRYDDLRGKFRLIKQKWNSLWPVIKRFWNRGKKGFRFHDASVMVKYSLDEHYLTGMMCGYIAPTIGFAKQYGVNWQPIAVFPEKPNAGIYSKIAWHIDIRVYMLLWAILCLFFEKNLYKEIYWLYKYKKEKKAKKDKAK